MYGWNRRQWPYDGRMGAHLDVELLYSLVAEHVSSRLDGDDVSVLSERFEHHRAMKLSLRVLMEI